MNWGLADRLQDRMGAGLLIDELLSAMGDIQANEILEYVARNWDVPIGDEDEEE